VVAGMPAQVTGDRRGNHSPLFNPFSVLRADFPMCNAPILIRYKDLELLIVNGKE
jgi:hypothetical protein